MLSIPLPDIVLLNMRNKYLIWNQFNNVLQPRERFKIITSRYRALDFVMLL